MQHLQARLRVSRWRADAKVDAYLGLRFLAFLLGQLIVARNSNLWLGLEITVCLRESRCPANAAAKPPPRVRIFPLIEPNCRVAWAISSAHGLHEAAATLNAPGITISLEALCSVF